MFYTSPIDDTLQDIICIRPILLYDKHKHELKEKIAEMKEQQLLDYQGDLQKHVEMTVARADKGSKSQSDKSQRKKPSAMTDEERAHHIRAQNLARKQKERENKRKLMNQILHEKDTN
jgi:hypothetical protein